MDSKKKKLKFFEDPSTCLLSQLRQHLLSSAEQPGCERWPGRALLPKRNEKGGEGEGSTRCKIRHEPLLIGHSVGVCALEDRWRGEERGRGEFISAHDATRRAKMKADGRLRGRLPWFRGPNRVQRTGAILASYLFAFDVTRLAPTDSWPLVAKTIDYFCVFETGERERERRGMEFRCRQISNHFYQLFKLSLKLQFVIFLKNGLTKRM